MGHRSAVIGDDEALTSRVGSADPADELWPDVVLWLGAWTPFVVVGALRARINWFPVQDQAVLDMRIRGLLQGKDIPLVGAFSRFGWSHPGPIWFYALAPFRALGGTDGLLAGSILLFGAGIATLPVVVRRRYGAGVAAIAVLALLPALMAAGSFTILVPWNPHLAFAWLPVFLVLALASIDRRPADLAPAVFVGAMLLQLHVGYLAIVLLPVVLVVALIIRRSGVSEIRQRAVEGRAWLIATVVFYIPPVVEQLIHGVHGNVGKLAKFFVAPPHGLGGPTGFRFAAGTLGGVLRWPPTGLGGSGERTNPFTNFFLPDPAWSLLPVVVAVGILYLLARRSGAREIGDALLFVCVVLFASLASLSRVVGERWPYLFTWRFAVVWFVVVVAVVGAAGLWNERRRTVVAPQPSRHARFLQWCALGLAVVLLAIAVVAKSVSAPYGHILQFERSTEQLASATLRTRRPDGVVQFVHFDGSVGGVADGVMNKLDEESWRVGAAPDLKYKYGDSHAISDNAANQIWFVSETSTGTTIAASLPGARVLAAVTPLPPSEDAELAALQRALVARMRATGHLELFPAVGYELVDLALAGRMDTNGIDVRRLAELNGRVARSGGCRCAVTVVPAGTVDDPVTAVAKLPASVIDSWRSRPSAS